MTWEVIKKICRRNDFHSSARDDSMFTTRPMSGLSWGSLAPQWSATQPRSLHLLEFHCRDRLFRLRPCWICLGLNALFGTMWQGTKYSKDQSYHFHQPLFYQLLTPFVYSKAKHINLCCHPPCRYQSTCKINFNNISVKIRKVRPIRPKKRLKFKVFDECAWRFDKMHEWRCYGGKATSKGFGSAQKSSSRRDTWNALEFKMKGCGLFSEETTLSTVEFINSNPSP